MLAGKTVLLVISGGIAAYKSLELIRGLKERGASCRAILTPAGAQFVTPLSVAALTENKVYLDLFSLTDESEMGHIQLSRAADVVVVAPATADLLARMASGQADDLATTALLATDKDVICAPAMNVRMWTHPATRDNLATLQRRGVRVVGPNEGDMACGEWGYGRMAEPGEIIAALDAYFAPSPAAESASLAGVRALVTSGPTVEPIDPVRYICNRSSGRQGHAIAGALAAAGAETTLVTGPTALSEPGDVTVIAVETAQQMLEACEAALPVDVAVCAAAVCDWRVADTRTGKIKKEPAGAPPVLTLTENPDILARLSGSDVQRPRLVVGFAAETSDVVDNAKAKRMRKGCDWMIANDVAPGSGTFGGEDNTVYLVTANGVDPWPRMTKDAVAARLVVSIAESLGGDP